MSQSKADYINVIGAGLAGSEAAYQIAKRGIPVKLYEMRGVKATPQHKTTNFAELVCSNSFRGDSLTNAVGLLKEEMRRLDSIIMRNGEAHRVPAGGAMAVDREGYAEAVTAEIENHPLIEVIREEITEIPDDAITVIASGPLTSDALAEKMGVSKKISSFTIPLGATINMDGTSIMQGVAVVFTAQAFGIHLSMMDYATVIGTATLASIGTAGVPSVGLITLTMVFNSVGLPVEGIALIMGIDRILDMTRTAVNITGDAVCTTVVASMNKAVDRDIYYGRK